MTRPDIVPLSRHEPPPESVDPCPQGKFVRSLLARGLVACEDWDALSEADRRAVLAAPDRAFACHRLTSLELLTPYQCDRILAGKRFGLVLGGYRVLDRLGAGGMGVVFRAENLLLRQPVAIKVVPAGEEADGQTLARFAAEARAVAGLRHPNIVAAIDAGVVRRRRPGRPDLHYFVMEYVPGQDLDVAVRRGGALPAGVACRLAYQLCGALAEAHRHGLVHRDIKPSNVVATPQGSAKLLDFGLALRDSALRLTQTGMVLGTAAFMAPEQITDPRVVDQRADLYSLGATLFWCLTGREPFGPASDVVHVPARRATAEPPHLRDVRPDLPVALSAVVARLMAYNPAERYQSSQEVMRALLPFLLDHGYRPAADEPVGATPVSSGPIRRVLVVDDEPELRRYYQLVLRAAGFNCGAAADGVEALELLRREPYDLLVLDLDMPELGGTELLHLLRESPPSPRPKVLVVSGWEDQDGLARLLAIGADDYLAKPLAAVPLTARAHALMRLRQEEERVDRLLVQLRDPKQRQAPGGESVVVEFALGLGRLTAARAREPATRPARVAAFCRTLASAAARLPAFRDLIDEFFVAGLAAVAPLYDVGKVAIPDHILFKPGPLDPEERAVMGTHTVIGAELIRAAERVLPADLLRTAVEVARSHHERFDGAGYPDRLTGEAIPLAARLVAVADAYESLRTPSPAHPALDHAAAVEVISHGSPGRFDPAVLEAFRMCQGDWEKRFREEAY